MKKESQGSQKSIQVQTALVMSFITLVAGFLGGVVFSAFKMDNSLPEMSAMMASEDSGDGQQLTSEQEKEIEALEERATAAPENAEAWIALGNACFDYNLTEKSIHAYEAALELQPENVSVWTDLGIMYRRQGDPQKAVAMFEKAQAISPGHEVSLMNEGIVRLHDMNDIPGAIDAWEKLLQINPTAATAGGMAIRELVDTLKSQL